METNDITVAVPVSIVEITELPIPPVVADDVIRVAAVAELMAAAVPPPAIMAKPHVNSGLKSTNVEAITAVPAMEANGIAIVSNKLSTNGM